MNLNIDKKRKVAQLTLNGEFIRSFESIEEASKTLKINSPSICNCCRKTSASRIQHTAGGFKWKYLPSLEELPPRDPLDDELEFLDNPYYD
jgi:hypothetical protein